MSRATDTHLVLRPHEEEGCVVMDAVVRSFPPPEPICLRWQFPVWTIADDLDPTALKRPTSRRPKPAKDDAEPVEAKTAWTAERFAITFLTQEPRQKNAILAQAELAGMTSRMARQFLALIEQESLAHRWRKPKSNATFFASIPQPQLLEINQ